MEKKKSTPSASMNSANNISIGEIEYVEILRQAVAVLPWGHNLVILNKDLPDDQVLFYAQETISKGWSREMLLHALKGDYYTNLKKTPNSNNFTHTLPAPVAEYANEVFRSRYNLGFLETTEPMNELTLEQRLVNKITRFIMELGRGFTFIGNQHILSYNGKDYKVDMLFQMLSLMCYCICGLIILFL